MFHDIDDPLHYIPHEMRSREEIITQLGKNRPGATFEDEDTHEIKPRMLEVVAGKARMSVSHIIF